ncbi:MAG: polyprenyl synthetase family protein [Candidatus Omnitrophica bacterium]|nr:polyprenyl synthetase family protein [Candidatus Omnitrophota bacterium]
MSPVAKLTLNDIYAPIDSDLKEFREVLREELSSRDKLIQEIHAHILKMSGKFLRPALTLLCARIGSRTPDITPVIRLSVAIELIHTATLVHDDIIDDSDFRRNQPSVHFKWGREISIVAGDYLYAKAFMLLAGLENARLNQAFAACAHIMCEGEMKQIERRHHFLMAESEYLKIIHQKTAALFQAACMGGAYFSGLDEPAILKMGDYGYRLGMAFQIVDDCLDLVGEKESLGKTIGLDIDKNDVTLPLLYLYQSLSAAERETLQGNAEMIRSLAIEKKAVEKAMALARQFVEEALVNLSVLAPSETKDSLTHLAQYCLDRVR